MGPPGWMEEWGRGRFADVGEDSGDGLLVGEEWEEGEGVLPGGGLYQYHFVKVSQLFLTEGLAYHNLYNYMVDTVLNNLNLTDLRPFSYKMMQQTTSRYS